MQQSAVLHIGKSYSLLLWISRMILTPPALRRDPVAAPALHCMEELRSAGGAPPPSNAFPL
ncbi:MAG: hypothetical protein AB9828_11190 [Sphaerochaetaceae bacterium]